MRSDKHSGESYQDEKDLPDPESLQAEKSLQRDKKFWFIWQSGKREGHLKIRSQISQDQKGRILYNNRIYNRGCWTWRPPKFIRLQGRLAKEIPDKRNSYPTEEETVEGKSIKRRAICHGIDKKIGCGGRFQYDSRLQLYCSSCFLIRSDLNASIRPMSIAAHAPMDEHDYSGDAALENKWRENGYKPGRDFV